MQANIDRFDRAAYEFSKLDSANTRVKLFFATFPYCTWNKDTKRWELDLSRNEYGVPTYMPMAYVYNMVVDEFGDAQSPEELLGLMEKAKGNDAFHSRLYQKYKMLFDAQHKTAKGGEQVIDYDA